jgi:hypothetical protein
VPRRNKPPKISPVYRNIHKPSTQTSQINTRRTRSRYSPRISTAPTRHRPRVLMPPSLTAQHQPNPRTNPTFPHTPATDPAFASSPTIPQTRKASNTAGGSEPGLAVPRIARPQMGPSRVVRGWRRGLGFRAFLPQASAAWRGVVAASSSDSGANPTPREWGER